MFEDPITKNRHITGITMWREHFEELGWQIVLVNESDISYKTYDTRRQESWCQVNLHHNEWHTFNGWWFAFKNKTDAIWFKTIWG